MTAEPEGHGGHSSAQRRAMFAKMRGSAYAHRVVTPSGEGVITHRHTGKAVGYTIAHGEGTRTVHVGGLPIGMVNQSGGKYEATGVGSSTVGSTHHNSESDAINHIVAEHIAEGRSGRSTKGEAGNTSHAGNARLKNHEHFEGVQH